MLSKFAPIDVEQKIAVLVQPNLSRAIKFQPDATRVGARRNDEIKFDSPLIAVKNQIDAGINLLISNSGESGDSAAPLRRIGA